MDHPNGTPRPDDQPASGGPAIDTLTPSGADNGATAPSSDATPTAESMGHGRAMTPMFLAELAHAMQQTADRERERIGAAVSEDAALNIERARARAVTETQELRRLAEEDVERIQAWSKAEMEQIQREAARRTDERRARLNEYLQQHDGIIDVEIAGVNDAVAEYNATLDRFFGELKGSSDPADIARRAGMLPTPPDLEAVRATARSVAVGKYAAAERQDDAGGASDEAGPESAPAPAPAVGPVGVMDPSIVTTPLPSETPAVLQSVDGEASPADDTTTTTANGSDQPSAAVRLLRSIAPWTAPAAQESANDSTGDSTSTAASDPASDATDPAKPAD
jgi:hypothetical protein